MQLKATRGQVGSDRPRVYNSAFEPQDGRYPTLGRSIVSNPSAGTFDPLRLRSPVQFASFAKAHGLR
eukprot:IDg14968t1